MNPLRAEILKKLMYQPRLAYSQLWDKSLPSNKFNYHLKVLEEDGLIEKKSRQYQLTISGKKFVTYLDGDSAQKNQPPLLTVLVAVIKDGKILLQRRTKEPFYGYWGLQGGKVKFNHYPLETAKEELLEETGLTGDLRLKGMMFSKTFQEKEQLHNHYLYVVLCRFPQGQLISQTKEGENRWVSLKDYQKLPIFPDLPSLIKIASCKSWAVMEIDRYQKEGQFTGLGNVRWQEY